jgi:hypothetical protein
MRRTLLFLAVFAFGVFDAPAATTSVKLAFTSPSMGQHAGGHGDWLYAIAPTSDGGYFAGGYAEVDDGTANPPPHVSFLKLDAAMNLEWEEVLTADLGYTEAGYIRDVIETPSFYIAAGNIGSELLVVTASKSNPPNVTTYRFAPKDFGFNTNVKSVDAMSIRHVTAQNGGDRGYVIAARAENVTGQRFSSFLLRLDVNFTIAGGTLFGVFPLTTAGSVQPVCFTVRPTHSASGEVNGFITVGALPAQGEEDVGNIFVEWVEAEQNGIFLNGTKTLTLTTSNLKLGNDPRGNPLCGSASLTTSKARAWDVVEIGDGGDFAVAAQADVYSVSSPAGCHNSRLITGYTDVRSVLLRLSLNPILSLRWAKEIGRFSGDDFQTPMVLMKDGFAVAGNDAPRDGKVINARVIKTDFAGNVIWTGDHLLPRDQNDCIFGIAQTADGDIVVAGNNDRNGEDYVALKIGPGCAPAPIGRVARYSFDDPTTRALDSDYGNNALWLGGPKPVPGVVASALSFDGVNDFAQAPPRSQIAIGTGDFTIQAWIRVDPADALNTRAILDKRELSRAGVVGYHIALINGVLWLQLADRGAGIGYSNFNSTINVADGQWHFFSVTVERASKTGIQWYLDGAPVPSGTADPTGRARTLTNGVPLRFGSRNASGGGWFRGALDELEIFTRALTSAEVKDTFGAGSAGRCQ